MPSPIFSRRATICGGSDNQALIAGGSRSNVPDHELNSLLSTQYKPRDECGVFAVFGHPDSTLLTYYGLFALQHRGQESAGIVSAKGSERSFQFHKGMGLVSQVFAMDELERLSGTRTAAAPLGRMMVSTLSFQGVGLIFVVRFLQEHQVSWAEGFGFRNQPRRAVLLGFLIAFIFLPVGWGLQQACGQLMTHLPHFKLHPEEQPAIQALRLSASVWNRFAFGAVAVLLVPFAEEMLFRGILYPAIKQAGFPRLALWGTSLLFAAVHTNVVTFVPLTVLALLLAALYERTNNLLAPIAAHAMFNAMNFASLLAQEYWGV